MIKGISGKEAALEEELCDLVGGDGLSCHQRLDGSHCKQCDRQDTFNRELVNKCNNLRNIRPELILRLLQGVLGMEATVGKRMVASMW